MLRALAVAAVVLVGLAVAAVVALPWLVDVLALRAWVAHAAGQAIGRPVRFQSITVRPLPLPTIQVRGLEVAEDPAFGSAPAIIVGEGRVGMRLRALLRGRVEPTEIALSDVRVELIADASGRLNIGTLGGAPPAAGAPRTGSPRSSGVSGPPVAPRMRVVNGAVRYRARGRHPVDLAVSRITGTLVQESPGGPLRLTGEAVLEPGGVLVALRDGALTPAAGRPLADAALAAVVELGVADAAPVVRRVLPAPEVQGAARARLQVGGTLGRPTALGTVTMDRAVLVEERRRCGEPPRRRLPLEKVELPVVLLPPRVESAAATARLAGGRVSARLALALDQGPAVSVSDLRIEGVEASAILVDYLCQPWAVRGPVHLTGELSARGPDFGATTAGAGRVRVGRGAVTGRDAAAVLEQVLALTGAAAALTGLDRGRLLDAAPLDFDSITASYTVAGGVVRSDDLLYEARGFRITGAGTYRLADGRLDLDATFTQGDNQVRASIAGGPDALRVTPTSVRIREGRDLRRLLDRLLR